MMINNEFKNKINIAKGFQYSVNIAFDLHNDEKIKGFIPTTASLEVLEDMLLSTVDNSSDRARILIGAYGKGKSHIILVLLSLLMRKEIELFDRLMPYIKDYSVQLYDFVNDFLNSDKKLLPCIIQSNASTLTQAFLSAIQKALEVEGFDDLMPETHFQAAINRIKEWEEKYPDTYQKFTVLLNEPVTDFILKLSEFDSEAYDKFVELFPTLTSGSIFNPFLGFDVIDLYSKVIEKLRPHGYSGIFVVYDEFSKFLEAGISKVSSVDIKLLQDFAEKCNRSKESQMHLLLISHKDISNYIDKLPKQKVDGWKGVSERFKHIELHNNFYQIYEIISTIIEHDEEYFSNYFKQYTEKFEDIINSLSQTNLFAELTDKQIETVVKGCFPMHPISTYILPRLSEEVAQNERTLFTFLSSKNKNTFSTFLETTDDAFPMLTPDYIYDYFEPLLRKEVYTSETYKLYQLTSNILNKLEPGSLGSRIIKTIALIYITGQFEKLPPVPDVIIDTFRETVEDISEITETLHELQEKQYVIYMKKSNNYLRLKNSIGIDIGAKIADTIEKNKGVYRIKDILNDTSYDNFMYPTSYNDDNEITRYFQFTFIEGSEFLSVDNWNKKIANITSDGVVYGIIASDAEEISKISEELTGNKEFGNRVIFILPQEEFEIEKVAFQYQAVKSLKSEADLNDDALIEEYNIYLEDLEEVIEQYICAYTKPETRKSFYYYMGKKQVVYRKAQISQLLSKICSEVYTDTPIINNESINKDFLPTVAINSRGKVIAGLLSNQLEPSLGMSGTGQEISIMRSTLVMTGIINDLYIQPQLIISGNPNKKIQNLLDEIFTFFKGTSSNRSMSFRVLYDRLTKPEYHIGLKKGVIPIYIAVILHSIKQYAVITRGNREIEINVELLNSINENPDEYNFCLEDWNEEKNDYIKGLEELFADNIVAKEKEFNTFAYIIRAMQRWFVSLPKYSKEMKKPYRGKGSFGSPISNKKLKFINSLKMGEINAREFLFVKVFNIFDIITVSSDVIDNIKGVKLLLDDAKADLLKSLILDVRTVFQTSQTEKATLSSIIKDWYEELKDSTKSHLFGNGEERVLELMRTISNDDKSFIERLAKAITGLRIDDWEDSTIIEFYSQINYFKKVVEEVNKNTKEEKVPKLGDIYNISFVDKNGKERNKTFNKTEYSAKGKLLFNEITAALKEYGLSLSDNEKRQVLMEILEKI